MKRGMDTPVASAQQPPAQLMQGPLGTKCGWWGRGKRYGGGELGLCGSCPPNARTVHPRNPKPSKKKLHSGPWAVDR